MISLRTNLTFPVCASCQPDHFIDVNGISLTVALGNEENGKMVGKESKDYIDLYGRS